MRELCRDPMFIPEYTITNKILKNISNAEYSKALVENTSILQSWEKTLKNETTTLFIYNTLKLCKINTDQNQIKRYIQQTDNNAQDHIKNCLEAIEGVHNISKNPDLDESGFKSLHESLSRNLVPKHKQGTYRSVRVGKGSDPEEVLAQVVEFFDWINSLEAKETHPIILGGISKAWLEVLQPFETFNPGVSSLFSFAVLELYGYSFKNLLCIEDYFNKTKVEYDHVLNNLNTKNPDFTKWLEYYSEALSYESMSLGEKIKLLAKDTKVARASGRARLNDRQERIIEYLQDYGYIQNKDYERVFPNVSEDTVLRELKKLCDMNIIVKKGSTKSSVYELK